MCVRGTSFNNFHDLFGIILRLEHFTRVEDQKNEVNRWLDLLFWKEKETIY